MADSYPLDWPPGWPRTRAKDRKRDKFGMTFGRSRDLLFNELRLMGVDSWNVVISSWLPVKRDGLPYAEAARRALEDPGVAVYFRLRGRQMVMARDAYDTVFGNLHSLKIAIQHLRGLERHGGATMMERAFEGFAALPEPGNAGHRAPWWKVFDYQQDPSGHGSIANAAALAGCETIYRQKAKAAHADNGGTHDQMVELNAAIAKAREVLR